jgi:hypothetical protein
MTFYPRFRECQMLEARVVAAMLMAALIQKYSDREGMVNKSVRKFWVKNPRVVDSSGQRSTARIIASSGQETWLDSVLWAKIRKVVTVSYNGSPREWKLAKDEWFQDLSDARLTLAASYLWFALRVQILKLDALKRGHTEHQFTVEEIDALAWQIYPKFSKIFAVSVRPVADTLLRAVGIEIEGRAIANGDFTMYSTAALGGLLENPETELDEIEAALATWCKKAPERF